MSARRVSRQSKLLNGAAKFAALLLAAAAGPVAAQDTAGADERDAQADIVVIAPDYVAETASGATKSDAPLVEVPQAVSVVTRDQIDLLGNIDVQQAVRYSAGVVGENYGPDLRFDFLTVRGFDPVQFIDGLQAPASATINNVGVDLYGFESIEILKGPSAVLYGASPPGGIYNLRSRRPDAEFGGELQIRYGTYDFKQAAGTVTGTLADGVTARLTGLYRDRDGQTDFVTAERAFLAPAVTVTLGADTSLTALGYYQDDAVDGETNGFLPVLGVVEPNPVGRVRRRVNLGEPDYNRYRRDQFAAGYEFSHRFAENVGFTQNARWSEYEEDMRTIYPTGLAADNRTVLRSNFPFRDDVAQFAVDSRLDAEVRTGRIEHDLLLGVDYRNYRESSAFAFAAAPSIDLFEPVYGQFTPVTPDFFPFTDQRLKQLGVYLQDQASLGGFRLTLTGRRDRVRLTNYRLADSPTDTQTAYTYRVGGSYVTDAGLAPYLSYATSFEPVVGQGLDGAAFRPSRGRQIEAGIKFDGRRLDGRSIDLFATAALFRIRQENVLTTDPTDVMFSVQTGEAKVEGVELEAVARIRDRLSLNASYTFANARVTESNVAGEEGARLFGQPRHKASLFADYSFTAGALAGLGLGGGLRYVSDSPGALPGPFTPVVYFTGESTLFDAVARYDVGDWRLSVNGTNLFDKRYAGRCNGPTGCFFGQARQLIATVAKRF